MKITRWSPVSRRNNTLDLDVTQQELDEFAKGGTYQTRLPRLTMDEKYFITTGVTPDEAVRSRDEAKRLHEKMMAFRMAARGTAPREFTIDVEFEQDDFMGVSARWAWIIGLPAADAYEDGCEERETRDSRLLLDSWREDGQTLEAAILRELDRKLYDELQVNDNIIDGDTFIWTYLGRVYRWAIVEKIDMVRVSDV